MNRPRVIFLILLSGKSSLDYDFVGGKTFAKAFGTTFYDESMAPQMCETVGEISREFTQTK